MDKDVKKALRLLNDEIKYVKTSESNSLTGIIARFNELETVLKKSNINDSSPVKTGMKDTKTQRGFETTEFEDTYGAKCSLQKSSSAKEDKIWFGVDDADPKIRVSKAKEHGLVPQEDCGWMEYPIPEDVLLSTRMHLNIEQVEELLPYLKRFVETGNLHE